MPSVIEISLNDNLYLIKQKLEEISVLLKKNTELTCTRPEFVWSIEYNTNDSFLLKYNYDKNFSKLIKSFGCMIWDIYLEGWVAHRDFENTVIFNIKHNFPEWKCVDKR
jgi:hypothetical protein